MKLKVPPKTQLYVEQDVMSCATVVSQSIQTQREKENCVHMHRIFQRDLTALRLHAGMCVCMSV